jgi:hypothetical protein
MEAEDPRNGLAATTSDLTHFDSVDVKDAVAIRQPDIAVAILRERRNAAGQALFGSIR